MSIDANIGGLGGTSPQDYNKLPKEDKKKGLISFKKGSIKPIDVIYIYFLLILGEKVQNSLEEKDALPLSKTERLQSLLELQTLLQALQAEDLSRDYIWAGKLTKSWHKLKKFIKLLKRDFPDEPEFRDLNIIKEDVEKYTQGDDGYSLAYYFDHYTGEKWIPVPFMDLLQSLHEEAKNSSGGHLNRWLSILTNITKKK